MIFRLAKILLLFFYGHYAFQKIIRPAPLPPRRLALADGIAAVLAVCTALAESAFPPLSILVVYIGLILLIRFAYSNSFAFAYAAATNAFGIVLGAYILSNALLSGILYGILHLEANAVSAAFDLVTKSIVLVLIFPCLFYLFRVKRFRSGMQYLNSGEYSRAGTYAAFAMILLCIWISSRTAVSSAFIAAASVAILLPFLILVWWRRNIRKRYLSLLRRQEIDALHTLTQKQQAQLQMLRNEKDALSAVIHRDNKLIPAMAHAVRTYLDAPQPQNAVGRQLLHELDEMTAERTGVLHAYESDAHSIQSTGDVALDGVLECMFEKAKALNIRFDTAVTEFQSAQSAQNISDADVKTILADLIENAMIACGGETHKFVLAHIGTMHKRMLIRVFDSGTAFDLQTLDKIGTERITTHADSGGSGIGTQTLFALKEKYRASIILHESPQGGVYTKDVSVLFDRLDQFIVKSSRADEIRKFCTRKDMIVLREA